VQLMLFVKYLSDKYAGVPYALITWQNYWYLNNNLN